VKVKGACGSANNVPSYLIPASDILCSKGPASAVSSGSTAWSWTCAGSGGGAPASCSAQKIINSVCGPATTTASNYASSPAQNTLCSESGTASAPVYFANNYYWQWSCSGQNAPVWWCQTVPFPTCGSATSTLMASVPTAATPNLCSIGSFGNHAGPTADGHSWYWDCINGSNAATGWCFASSTNLLTASCAPSPSTANVGQLVTWTVTPSGGSGTYTYSWTGTDGLTGTTPSVTHSYSSIGTYYATTTVRDGINNIVISCPGTVSAGGPNPGGCSGRCGGGVHVGNSSCSGSYDVTQYKPCSGNAQTNGIPWTYVASTSASCLVNPVCKYTDIGASGPATSAALDCKLTTASSTSVINTNTTWTGTFKTNSDLDMLGYTKTWTVSDANTPSPTPFIGPNPLYRIFTTVGLKTVSLTISSSTSATVGASCTATTTVIQNGAIQEQ